MGKTGPQWWSCAGEAPPNLLHLPCAMATGVQQVPSASRQEPDPHCSWAGTGGVQGRGEGGFGRMLAPLGHPVEESCPQGHAS